MFGLGLNRMNRQGSKVNQNVLNFATKTGPSSVLLYVRLPIGNSITFLWGDGTSTFVEGIGNSNVSVNKDYENAGTFGIKITGDFDKIFYAIFDNNSFTGSISDWYKFTDMSSLRFSGNSLAGTTAHLAKLLNLTFLTLTGNFITGDALSLSNLVLMDQLFSGVNNITGTIPNIGTNGVQVLQMQANNITGSSIDLFRPNMTDFNISNQKVVFPTSEIDKLLLNLANYYEVNAPTANVTINMSGANMGIPTNGSSNADLTRLVGYYTAAGRTCNVLIRTS